MGASEHRLNILEFKDKDARRAEMGRRFDEIKADMQGTYPNMDPRGISKLSGLALALDLAADVAIVFCQPIDTSTSYAEGVTPHDD